MRSSTARWACLHLREGSAWELHATQGVQAILEDQFPVRRLLERSAQITPVTAEPVRFGNVKVTWLPLDDHTPRYHHGRRTEEPTTCALVLRSPRRTLVYAPSLSTLDDLNTRTICGGDFLKRKHEAATRIRASGTPLILNAVLHRLNPHEVPALLQFAADSGAERIELANSQDSSWALENRAHLLLDLASLQAAEAEVLAFRASHAEVAVQWVVPDDHDASSKPCMGGWARTHVIVGSDGRALPCPAAYVLPELALPTVTTSSLEEEIGTEPTTALRHRPRTA